MLNKHKLSSMTGLGQARLCLDHMIVEVVVRSVNSRGLDIKIRLPRELAFLETELHAMAIKLLERGRVDISCNFEQGAVEENTVIFDELKASMLIDQLTAFASRNPVVKAEITLGQLLSGHLLMEKSPQGPDGEALRELTLNALSQALTALQKSRELEGAILAPIFQASLARCQELLFQINSRADTDVKNRFSSISARINELFDRSDLNQERIYQECALLAERSDYKEEVDRLDAHLKHFEKLCIDSAPKGRRLDFLCQEMLRESGTLLTKAFEHSVMTTAIELKAEIERLREQVQNIE